MATFARFRWQSLLGPLAPLFVAMLVIPGFISGTRAASGDEARAAEYVRLALAHEAHGQQEFRQHLLEAALLVSPDYAPAHWHLGHVQVDGRWVPAAEAQKIAAEDETLARYGKLRDKALGDPRRELALARLAQKEQWEDRAELHLANIALNPAAPPRIRDEAARRLDLMKVNGILLTEEEAQHAREVAERVETAIKTWRGRLEEWRRQIEVAGGRQRETALAEMAGVDDPDVIPAAETFLLDSGALFGEQLIRILHRLPQHDATRTLVRFAVLSPWENVRDLAINELKQRPMHEYVPLLLDGLVAPIRSQFSIAYAPDGSLRYRHHFFRREAGGDRLVTREHVAQTFVQEQNFEVPVGGELPSALNTVEEGFQESELKLQLEAIRALQQAAAYERAVESSNLAILTSNEPIFIALERTTGQRIGRDPADWQAWWQGYNEVYSEKPTYYEYYPSYRNFLTSYFIPVEVDPNRCSCFSAGTPVWTETGVVPVERVKPGDRVLSQDPTTGELAYKVVQQTTAFPPTSGTVRVILENESILMTRAHVVWVNNQGWKMAKELQAGDQLHGFDRIRKVQGIEHLPPEPEVYNLVVDDFSTFFVGKEPVLVYDITSARFRRPTTVSVPGLAWK